MSRAGSYFPNHLCGIDPTSVPSGRFSHASPWPGILFGSDNSLLREVRADQYGIRTQLEATRIRVKFKIVREAHVDLSGKMDPRLGVPVLTRSDMYCEKLLANADRYADTAVLSRDMIDLSMMISGWGPIPNAAWDNAEAAYGQTVKTAYDKAVVMIRNPA